MKKLILIFWLIPFVLSAQFKLTYKPSEIQTILNDVVNKPDRDSVVMLNGTNIQPLPAGLMADTILVFKYYNGSKNVYWSIIAAATSYPNYYVSSSDGDDADNGLTPATAWRTVSRVNDTTFAPGSKISFKRGDTWREKLVIPSSGTSSNRITISAYGTGSKPIFNAADVKTGWAASYGPMIHVWGIADPSSDAGQAVVVINGVWYDQVGTLAELTTANTYFVKTASTPDSLYIYSVTSPNTVTSEVGARDCGIYATEKSYVTIQNVAVRNACKFGIELVGGLSAPLDAYSLVDSCYGIHNRLAVVEIVSNVLYGYNNVTVTNCVSDYNGNGVVGWEGANNMTVTHCQMSHGIHNWVAGGGTNSDGTGVQFYKSTDCMVEYCNLGYNWGNIYLDPHNLANIMTARYNYIHDSYTTAAGAGGVGIGGNQVLTGGAMNVYYNLIVNGGGNEVAALDFESPASTGVINIYNNTIVNNGNMTGHIHQMAYIAYGANVTLKNNVFYEIRYDLTQTFSNVRIANATTPAIVSDYNQFYTNYGTPYLAYVRYLGNYYYTIATWTAVLSQDAHSAGGDPLFTNALSDWTLQIGSPARNTGVVISGIPQVDILGHPIVGLPDKGCYEYQ